MEKALPRTYHVYILTNFVRTLYIGVTGNLVRRVAVHRERRPGSFTGRYFVWRLVYAEEYRTPMEAIAREKQLKGWTRKQKLAIINKQSPTWSDYLPEERRAVAGDPSTRRSAARSG